MRILAAFDKFKDSFSAEEACGIVSHVSAEYDSQITIEECPLTDGGEGFVSILGSSVKGEFLYTEARDSLGVLKKAPIALVNIGELPTNICSLLKLSSSGKLAIIEMASVCGLSDLGFDQRDPWQTSTVGVGDLLLFAAENGADFILLGIGGSSTNDIGMGALTALGLKIFDSKNLPIGNPSPNAWHGLSRIDASGMIQIPPIRIACDVDNPLLGTNGATTSFGPQKGLKKEQIELMEKEIIGIIQHLNQSFSLTDANLELSGSGAAGGLGYGLSLAYNVQFIRGSELISKWLGIEESVKRADLVISGEGYFDQTSFNGKGPFEIIQLAHKYQKPMALICGNIDRAIRSKLKELYPHCRYKVLADPKLSLNENLERGPQHLGVKCLEVIKEQYEKSMNICSKERDQKYRRIRRLKKFLRPLPRRSNVHKYPILKWFSDTAYRRSYLWSFRSKEIQSALFFGLWISLLPIVGIQMLVVFVIALWVRANLPLIVALQWVSNPFTMGPIYFADYKIGMVILNLLQLNYPANKLLSAHYDWSQFSFKELLRLIDTFPPMLVGGSVLGVSFGLLAVFLYKIISKFYK